MRHLTWDILATALNPVSGFRALHHCGSRNRAGRTEAVFWDVGGGLSGMCWSLLCYGALQNSLDGSAFLSLDTRVWQWGNVRYSGVLLSQGIEVFIIVGLSLTLP